MKKIAIIIVICAAVISCNSNDTSQGIPDSTKVSLDTPKAVVADSAKQGADPSRAKKDTSH